ncbi:hypothetical protein EVG20_g10269 [Dentipellis fragilis]|uniref:DUF6533 domain-containing protein n=1 Tax=Dentipellis fragilis TaxID=205917 RepID=A0A4Y9XUJ3_9AGAM|nr:hypothetical protein EVG20_g10269 [Dentipellis fragilis]
MDDSAAANEIVIVLQQTRVVSYFVLGAVTLLSYDFVLNLSDEVELIWRSRWNAIKILYLLNRYFAFANMVIGIYQEVGYNISSSRGNCIWNRQFGDGPHFPHLGSLGKAQWARIHHRDSVCCFLPWAVLSVYVDKFTRSLVYTIAPGLRGCFITDADKALCICWSIALAYETLIVCLTLIKALQNFRHSASPLLLTIYRDGILSYMSLLVSSITDVLVIRLAPRGYMNLLFGFQHALHIVLTSRMILNIRRNAPTAADTASDIHLEQTVTSSELTTVSQP